MIVVSAENEIRTRAKESGAWVAVLPSGFIASNLIKPSHCLCGRPNGVVCVGCGHRIMCPHNPWMRGCPVCGCPDFRRTP
jgi:hypothetical protein